VKWQTKNESRTPSVAGAASSSASFCSSSSVSSPGMCSRFGGGRARVRDAETDVVTRFPPWRPPWTTSHSPMPPSRARAAPSPGAPTAGSPPPAGGPDYLPRPRGRAPRLRRPRDTAAPPADEPNGNVVVLLLFFGPAGITRTRPSSQSISARSAASAPWSDVSATSVTKEVSSSGGGQECRAHRTRAVVRRAERPRSGAGS
jgi:hypothetical protein